MSMRLRFKALLCVAAVVGAGATAAEAQVCAGALLQEGEWSVRAGAGRAAYRFRGEVEATDVGVDARGLPLRDLGVLVGYTYRAMDGSTIPVHVLRGGADGRIPTPALPLQLCVRAQTGVAFASESASGTHYVNVTVPLGISAGMPYRLRNAVMLTPYIAPAVMLSRLNGQVLDVEVEESDIAAGLEVGVGARLRRWGGGVGVWLNSLAPEVGTAPYPRRAIRFQVGVIF